MRIHSFFVYPLLDFFEIYGRLASIKANARASHKFTKKNIRILTKRINSLHRDRGKKMTCLKRITNKCRFFVSFIFLGRVNAVSFFNSELSHAYFFPFFFLVWPHGTNLLIEKKNADNIFWLSKVLLKIYIKWGSHALHYRLFSACMRLHACICVCILCQRWF